MIKNLFILPNGISEYHQKVFDDYLITHNMTKTGENFGGISRQRVQQIIKPFGYKKPLKHRPSKEEKEALRIRKRINTFWSHIDIKSNEECWEWTGTKYPSGYGHTKVLPSDTCAHRASWILANGEILNGLYVLHKCDNKSCCNPNHLYLGTAQDNANDRQERFYKNGKIPLHKKDRV